MGKANKQRSWKNREKSILNLDNIKNRKTIIHPTKILHTIKNQKVKNSTIETKFDKFGNNVSLLETSNKVDEEKVAKENNN